MTANAFARDKSYAFKFKVGDRVVKRWRWTKERAGRHDGNFKTGTIPIGSVGKVAENYEDGDIAVDFFKCSGWVLGASELDFALPLPPCKTIHPGDSCPDCEEAGLSKPLPLVDTLLDFLECPDCGWEESPGNYNRRKKK